MSLVGDILNELWNTEVRDKAVTTNLFGIPRFKNKSKRVLRSSVDRMIRNGQIKKELNAFILTSKGKEYLKRKGDSLKIFNSLNLLNKPKNLIVMFDMPIHMKAEREWFRWHLKKFEYEMIQQSVWVGPSPLPKDFLNYIREIKLNNCIKTFKLARPYISKD